MFSLSRKMKKAMCRDGERRRSPRISAIDASKETREEKLPIQYSRTRNKRKPDGAYSLKSTSKLGKQLWKGRDITENNDHATINMEWRSIRVPGIVEGNRHPDHAITNGRASVLPPKETLFIVLETLKSRDTYDLFAEPVESDEVEDYYEIIKEPMNFAMILAKLHEDMYQNLEEFEHDVFLIPENAMFFNSASTVYFKQARAIHDLAKKVFHALKEDPVKFAIEYSEPRRRSMRKALSDDLYRETLNPASGPSTLRRGSRKNTVKRDRFHSRNLSMGNRHDALSFSDVPNKRMTYLTWRPPVDKGNGSPRSLFCSPQPLVLINHEDFSYKGSLMSFVKDLGPVAQMAAKRKLSALSDSICSYQPEQCPVSTVPQRIPDNAETIETNANLMIRNSRLNQFQRSPASEAHPQRKPDGLNSTRTNKCRSFSDFDLNQSEKSPISEASQRKPDNVDATKTNTLTFRDFASSSPAFVKLSSHIDMTREGEDENRTNRIGGFGLQAKSKTDFGTAQGKEKVQVGTPARAGISAQTGEKSGNVTARKGKRGRAVTLASHWASVARNRRSKTLRRAYRSNKGTCSLTDGANPDEMARPVLLALEYPPTSISEYKPRNKRTGATLSLNAPPSTSQAIVPRHGEKEAVVAEEPPQAVVPQFTFNLAFLKERLGQMNGAKKVTPENRGAERRLNLTNQQEEIRWVNSSQPFMHNQPHASSSNNSQPFMHNQAYASSSNSQPFMHNQAYAGSSNNSQPCMYNQAYAGSSLDPNLRLYL